MCRGCGHFASVKCKGLKDRCPKVWGGRKNGHNRFFDGKHPGLKEVLIEGQRCTTDLDFAEGERAFLAKEAFWDFASEGGLAQKSQRGNPGGSGPQGSPGSGGKPKVALRARPKAKVDGPAAAAGACPVHPGPEGHEVDEADWPDGVGRPPGGADDGGVWDEVEVEVDDGWAAGEVAAFFGLGL